MAITFRAEIFLFDADLGFVAGHGPGSAKTLHALLGTVAEQPVVAVGRERAFVADDRPAGAEIVSPVMRQMSVHRRSRQRQGPRVGRITGRDVAQRGDLRLSVGNRERTRGKRDGRRECGDSDEPTEPKTPTT
jgi:hypothetical protein